MTIFSRENRCTARRADRILDKTIAEAHPLFRQPVHIRRHVDLAPVSADRMRRVIIRHDEQNIWPPLRMQGDGGEYKQANVEEFLHNDEPQYAPARKKGKAFRRTLAPTANLLRVN